MKKAILISGIAAVLFLALLLSGWADSDNAANIARRLGDQCFAEERYAEAQKHYEAGLEIAPDDKPLSTCAAQAAYMAGDYAAAVAHFENSIDSVDKFLNMGNAFFRMGEASEDQEQQLQLYLAALDTYREGILLFPRNVPLKYNYETLLEMIEAQQEGEEQEGEEQEGEEQDMDEIARILEILESQEEESLKNNREVIESAGDTNGW